MKNFKRAAAIIGVIILAAAALLPLVFALGSGEDSYALFKGAIGAAILLPVIAYAFLLVYQYLIKKKTRLEEDRMIENIIFDVGNVLVGFRWKEYLRSFGFSEEKFERIADATFRNRIWDERDRGCFSEEEYRRMFVAEAPEYETDILEVVRRAPEAITKLDYPETWTKYLKSRGYHLYVLSNYSDYMLAHSKKKMNFLPYMDGALFSCEVKELKPEPAIYQKLLDMYHLDPEKSVFIDDREENCQGARAVGIHAICFKDFKQAAGELEEKYGVK